MATSRKSSDKLSGARVLVLGGTSGFGFCVAEAAREHGAHVIVSSSTESKVSRAIERLRQLHAASNTSVAGFVCNLGNRESQENNLNILLEHSTKEGPLDHICFTAGDSIAYLPLKETTANYVHDLLTVRFLGAIMLAKVAPRYLKPGHTSSITFTGGALATKPVTGMGSVVPAVSAALEGLVRGLTLEMAPVRVNAISPGACATEYIDNMPAEVRDQIYASFRKTSVADQVGKPEDVAEAYMYTMRDNFVTGTVINTNGGMFLT